MKLTETQIEFIAKQVEREGVNYSELNESLVDHICCAIEASSQANFENAFAEAIQRFGSGGLKEIQEETIYLLILKKEIFMKKSMFIIGYLALFLSTTGLMFKLMHWPGAGVMLVLGIASLNLGFLPMYFYNRYKASVSQ